MILALGPPFFVHGGCCCDVSSLKFLGTERSSLAQPLSLVRPGIVDFCGGHQYCVFARDSRDLPTSRFTEHVEYIYVKWATYALHSTPLKAVGASGGYRVQMDQEKQPLTSQPRGITAYPAYIYLILSYYLITKRAARSPFAARTAAREAQDAIMLIGGA